MKYIDADQLKAEIDKRYTEYRAKMKTDDFTYYEGMADALDLFEQFLDTLPEQPVIKKSNALFDKCVENCDPAVMKEVSDEVDKILASEGPEEAAEKHIEDIWGGAGHPGWDWGTRDVFDAYIAGAEWQKAKMMEEAVEGEVYSYSSYKREATAILVDIPKDKLGDKVRVIVIKEDER